LRTGQNGSVDWRARAAKRFTIDKLDAQALQPGMQARCFPGVLVIERVINPGSTKTGRVAGALEAASRASGKSDQQLLK